MRVGAPSPTIRPMTSSENGCAPYETSVAFAESAMSLRESTSVPSRSKTMRRRLEATSSFCPVFGERSWRFPDLDAHHGKTLAGGVLENEPGDALDGRVAVEEIDRLAQLLQGLQERIVAPEHHPVIELLVDPPLDSALDVAEVADHVASVERRGSN